MKVEIGRFDIRTSANPLEWRLWFYPGGTGCLEDWEWILVLGPVGIRRLDPPPSEES